MSLEEQDQFDARKFKEELLTKRAIHQHNELRTVEALETIKRLIPTVNESTLQKLEERGIYLRGTIQQNLDDVFTNPEKHAKIQQELVNGLRQLRDLMRSESGNNAGNIQRRG